MIYAQGLPAALALRQQTTTIPIVFTQVIDPVGFKLADSLGHPGVQVVELRTHNDGETEALIATFGGERNTSLLVIPERFTNGHRDHIVAQCARFRVPAS